MKANNNKIHKALELSYLCFKDEGMSGSAKEMEEAMVLFATTTETIVRKCVEKAYEAITHAPTDRAGWPMITEQEIKNIILDIELTIKEEYYESKE